MTPLEKSESGNTSSRPAPPVTAKPGPQAFQTLDRLHLFKNSYDKIQVMLLNYLAGYVPSLLIYEVYFP
jgi:hypothetical protein